MAGRIIIADRDIAYGEALARRIRQNAPACTVQAVSDEQSLRSTLSATLDHLILIVSETHFELTDLPDHVRQVIPLRQRRLAGDPSDSDEPVRLGSVRPILKRLDLNGLTQSERQPLPFAIIPDEAGQPAAADQPRVFLFLTQTIRGRDSQYADRRCRQLAQAGCSIHYLPLMPSYYCHQWNPAAAGQQAGLTDLLLRISTGGLDARMLGTFCAMDPLGRLHFRPAERADDVLQSRADDLYRLGSLLRDRIQADRDDLLVIEAAGIAFHQIRPIVALCDQIEVIIPEGSDFASDVMRHEIGDLLAELPTVCTVIRVPDAKQDPLSSDQAAQAMPMGEKGIGGPS